MAYSPRIFALIVAAGTGSRAGGLLPKQYQMVDKNPLVVYSIEALARHALIAGVQVVIHPDHGERYANAVPSSPKLLPAIDGGEQRSDSVRAGLEALAAHAPDYVLVHDAARPFLSASIIDALIEKLSAEQAVVPALPVADTVRRFDGEGWAELARDGLMRIQTPQAFPFKTLQKIYETGVVGTDEAAVWLAAGLKLAYVEGNEELRKVTTAADIDWATQHVAAPRRIAVGMGYDVHALVPAGEAGVIRLGGVDIKHSHKLHGHSDADVVLHAIVDALLGTIGAGDIGSFFPPSDVRWKGANSAIFIEEARAQVAARGGVVQHVDVTIIGEQPKISPHREAMRASIAAVLKLPLAYVSVKATTTEKLGFTGREEGIACQAVATVSLPMEAA